MQTFVCKGTFNLRPRVCALAAEQEPIHVSERHWRDDPYWSLYAASDLVPHRLRADIVLVGHAFSPNGTAVRSLTARVIVNDVDKAIEVHGARSVTQHGVLDQSSRFTKMPLLWEYAGGGPGTSNPVGMPPHARDIHGRRNLPNLQRRGAVVIGPDDVIEPVGFGPVASGWPTRRQKLGRHAATFPVNDWHRQPLPPDLDVRYFNAAPFDQQTTALRNDERLILEHLHPEHPHLVTSLPGLHPRAYVDRPGEPSQAVPMWPDLLWINTDRSICTVTWRGQVPLREPQEAGQILVALEGPHRTLVCNDSEGLPRRSEVGLASDQAAGGAMSETALQAPYDQAHDGSSPALNEDDPEVRTLTLNVDQDLVVSLPALPFATVPAGQPAPPSSPAQRLVGPPFGQSAPPAAAVPPSSRAQHLADTAAAFVQAAPPAAAVPADAAQPPDDALAATDAASLVATKPALPFVQGERAEPAPRHQAASSPRGAVPAEAPDKELRPPLVALPPALPPALHAPPAAERDATSPPLAAEEPVPPPMLGPLARPDLGATEPSADEAPEPGTHANKPDPLPAAEEPAPPLAAYPIERCAVVAATLAQRPGDCDTLLKAEELTPKTWQWLHAHWLDEIQAELARRKKKLLSAYDAAYVAALEKERGPITAGEYAQLVIAAEQGQGQTALAELGLPDESMMPIRRVWLERIVKDQKAAAEVRAAMRKADEA
ncbi:DUF2169 family type VI secretion system accessory protein [Sorangium sp. So ce1335]|uniref:DUF2169 family type VI secretion system accessory protein n=1 Tax=Sorangium sp. So ce1335 TaxID=3133335 RepID=UPI003F5E6A55